MAMLYDIHVIHCPILAAAASHVSTYIREKKHPKHMARTSFIRMYTLDCRKKMAKYANYGLSKLISGLPTAALILYELCAINSLVYTWLPWKSVHFSVLALLAGGDH